MKAILLSIPFIFSLSVLRAQETKAPNVGFVTIQQNDAGCSFSRIGDKFNNVLIDDASAGPWINIDGKDVKLEKLENTTPEKLKEKTIFRYKIGKIRVTLTLDLVSQGGEGGVAYKGEMVVTRGAKKAVLMIEGGCGC